MPLEFFVHGRCLYLVEVMSPSCTEGHTHGPWATSSFRLFLKVLLAHGHTHLSAYCLWSFLTKAAALNGCDRGRTHKAQRIS